MQWNFWIDLMQSDHLSTHFIDIHALLMNSVEIRFCSIFFAAFGCSHFCRQIGIMQMSGQHLVNPVTTDSNDAVEQPLYEIH